MRIRFLVDAGVELEVIVVSGVLEIELEEVSVANSQAVLDE